MALLTKLQVVQEIIYEVYGGMQNNDTTISENFVLRKLNNKIAESAVKSAFGTYNLDGVVYADDIFTLTYTAIPLLTDTNSGLKYFVLPAQPVGLPSKRAMTIFPPKSRGGFLDDLFKPIMRHEVTYVRRLPSIKKVFHFTENGNEYFVDNFNLMATFSTLNLSIVSSGALNLTDYLNLPDDMIAGIKTVIIQELRQMLGIQDTTPMPPQDTPQPR